MKHAFYFRFYRMFHHEALCCFLASFAYFLYCVKFFVRKTFRKRVNSTMTVEEAHRIINEVYPKPESNPKYMNPEIDKNLDLSIIVTVYNYEDKIQKNIESCINQETKYNYEVIFVNDGSTDSSGRIIEKYVDNKKVKLINKINGGAGSARNVGINNACGKYIMFVDCDDILHNDIVEKLLNEAFENNLDIAMCAHNLVKEKNNTVISVAPFVYPAKNYLKYNNNPIIMNYPGFPWGKVYRRELLNDIRFPEEMWYEDTIVIMQLFVECRSFKYISVPLYDYYFHERNITHTVSNTKNIKAIDRYWVLCEIIDYYENKKYGKEASIYELLLRHASLYYYKDLKNLNDNIVEALFVSAKDLTLSLKPSKRIKLSYSLRMVEKSFLKNDISLWRLASVYQ